MKTLKILAYTALLLSGIALQAIECEVTTDIQGRFGAKSYIGKTCTCAEARQLKVIPIVAKCLTNGPAITNGNSTGF
jgi:hypothetical protein